MLRISYEEYLDRVHGGWLGKCLGGAVGARFEGCKEWIELEPEKMLPPEMPPNDDLDLQVLWLKVLEEKGPHFTSDDLAEAWLRWCWYPFNEYGNFRRNYRLGIHPPYSGTFNNDFYSTGEGCPIRAEIWGYVLPGAPDIAAELAGRDGVLDHAPEVVAAEKMLAAMASLAFFVHEPRRLLELCLNHLVPGSRLERLVRLAIRSYDDGLALAEARQRIMAVGGLPEACDAQINIPFTVLALLYGRGDLVETLLCALRCGYDTDCTLATAGALIGQILGGSRFPQHFKDAIGDKLVMGIEYKRPEMTISALARDTARLGVLFARELSTGVVITGAPELAPLPPSARRPERLLVVRYGSQPAAAPGELVHFAIAVEGELPAEGAWLELEPPDGWDLLPRRAFLLPAAKEVCFCARPAPDCAEWPQRHLFSARLVSNAREELGRATFGFAGAALWAFLGAYYDPAPPPERRKPGMPVGPHHYVALDRAYIPEPGADVPALVRQWTRLLGRPAILPAHTHRLELGKLLGLEGEYCAYLARTVISPEERDVFFVLGNNDGYRLYLNGELVAEADECLWWTPFNRVCRAHLRQGKNEILLKLLKRGQTLEFSFGILDGHPQHFGFADWLVDLADANPFLYLTP